MTKSRKLYSIATLALLSAFLQARTSYAQEIDTFNGFEDVFITYENNGNYSGSSQQYGIPTELTVVFYPDSSDPDGGVGNATMGTGGYSIAYGFRGYVDANPFVVGNYTTFYGYDGESSGNFLLSPGNNAAADMVIFNLDASGTGEIDNILFSSNPGGGGGSVPEPSSMVQAATGLLAVAILIWLRGLRS
ncbi:MAG: hypothetical protein ACLQGP_05545 [Isosphaeraceae bacterium]